MKLSCLFLLPFFFFSSCKGQVRTSQQQGKALKSFPRLVQTQGRVSGNVMCEFQDKDGSIWFSTSGEGVYRYNGDSFTNFTTKDGLPGNDIGSIIPGKNGDVLFATQSGVYRYDGHNFSPYFQVDSLQKLDVSCLFEDREGRLWFSAMSGGVYCYDGKACKLFLKGDRKFNLGSSYQLILDILQDKAGNIWFSSWNGGGVWKYDGSNFLNFVPSALYYETNEDGRDAAKPSKHSAMSYISRYQPTDHIHDDMIFSIYESRSGELWFATRNHGACRYDGKTFTSYREQDGFTSRGIYDILEDRNGNIWLTTESNGVYRYDGKTFRNFTTEDGLHHNSVFSILEDKEGNIWFGSRGLGLTVYDGERFSDVSGNTL
jgi:ligand-binding sensor domain-containing protein